MSYPLNERIALALKWRQNLETADGWFMPDGTEYENPGIPDWAGDKNLVLEEKKKLEGLKIHLFEKALEYVTYRDRFGAWSIWGHENLHMASSNQEAEALAMTLEALQ